VAEVALVVILALAACTAPPMLPQGSRDRPDIVLVSIDTLRADHLHSYGYARATSPTIDALAARGALFLDARSPAPWTLPAHATMLTGLLPANHEVIEDGLGLADDTPRLASALGTAGYRTGAFVTALFVSRTYGFDRGFERFEDFDIRTMKENLTKETDAGEVVDAALDWWSTIPAEQPVFLFLHFYDVHYDYDPPGSYGSLFDRRPSRKDPRYRNYQWYEKHPLDDAALVHQEAQYDEAIRYVDDQIARVVSATAGRNVLWAITADHGEELGERGSWGHAHTLYTEQLHVPLVISGQGVESERVDEAVGLQDIAPTLAAWGGAEMGGDGIDLSPTLRDSALPPTRAFFADTSRFDSNRAGVLMDGLRLEWDLAKGTVELFDDHADPQENSDVHALLPGETTALQHVVAAEAGAAWTARRAGTVRTSGVVLVDGAAHTKIHVDAGQSFRVVPSDAQVRMDDAGPWQAIGGARPGPDDALAIEERTSAPSTVELDAATKKRHEALGYVQGN
jgi:arylsulfatase A-like enzyme